MMWTKSRAQELRSIQNEVGELTQELRSLLAVTELDSAGRHDLIVANEGLAVAQLALAQAVETVFTIQELTEALREMAIAE
jgi:hypothetical protein